MKKDKQDKARELRVQGNSLSKIAKELGVSKSSVSLWVRDLMLSSELTKKLNMSGGNSNRIKNENNEIDNNIDIRHLPSSLKGAIGELAISKDLVEKGFSVFKDITNYSRTDLVVDDGKDLIRVQVKTRHCNNSNSVKIPSRRSPNQGTKSIAYKDNEVDVFALYIPDIPVIIYIPAYLVLSRMSELWVRVNKILRTDSNSKYLCVQDFLDFITSWEKQKEYNKTV